MIKMLEHFGKKSEQVMYFLFRVFVGLMFAMHGMQKLGWLGELAKGSPEGFAIGMGLPVWIAYIVALTELLAGLGIALGLFTRLASIGGFIVMVFAQILAHLPKSIFPIANGGELSMMYLLAFLVLFAIGAGKWSLGKALFRKELW
jgi:putative oxidoreductase